MNGLKTNNPGNKLLGVSKSIREKKKKMMAVGRRRRGGEQRLEEKEAKGPSSSGGAFGTGTSRFCWNRKGGVKEGEKSP